MHDCLSPLWMEKLSKHKRIERNQKGKLEFKLLYFKRIVGLPWWCSG